MSVKLRRGFTLPNPELDFSSRRFDLEVEAPTYEEASELLDSLILQETKRKFPDLFVANDRFARLKLFMWNMSKDPTIGQIVKSEWKKFISKPEPMEIDNQAKN